MDFLSEHRDPREVYQAAMGDPSPLADRIRSGAAMNRREREALALLISGELRPPKRPSARHRKATAEKLARFWQDPLTPRPKQRIRNAVALYKYLMSEAQKQGIAYGSSEAALAWVAEYDGIAIETLRNALRRSGGGGAKSLGLVPREAFARAEYSGSLRDQVIGSFHNWCQLQWANEDMQQLLHDTSPKDDTTR